MINAIALDDEIPALKVLENFCSKVDYIKLQKSFSSTLKARTYLDKNTVDLLFLDINMPAISGIDFYKSISQETMVIFTTAYSEYAVEGFNLKAVDYLLKPFKLDRFLQAVEKARDFHTFNKSKATQTYMFVRADYSLIKVDFDLLLYVEAMDDYLRIWMQEQKPIVTRMTMKAMEEKLPSQDFVRVHRSYIVQMAKIKNLRKRNLLIDEKEIPVSKGYLDKLKQAVSRLNND